MGGKSPGSAYITVQMTVDEKTILDRAAEAAGQNRNAFIRKWINSLAKKK